MTWQHKPRDVVYVVVRLDDGPGADEHRITVKEVVHDEALAAAEVQRLNGLNAGRGARYFYQTTRLYPPGYSAGSFPPDGEPPLAGPAA